MIKDKALKKTITYRIMAGLGGALIVWIFTGNPYATAGASVTGEIYRSVIYYGHEKLWEQKKPTDFLAPVKCKAFNLEQNDKNEQR